MKLQSNTITHFMTRTTIELTSEHRVMLRAIAISRGWRGFSRVIEQAIGFYLDHHAGAEIARLAVLECRGRWSVDEARKTALTIREGRAESDIEGLSTFSSVGLTHIDRTAKLALALWNTYQGK